MEEGAGLEDRAVLSVATGDKHKWEGRKEGFRILCSTTPPIRNSGEEWEGSRGWSNFAGPGPNLFSSNHHPINCLLFLSCVINLPLYWIIPISLQRCHNISHLKNPTTLFDVTLPPKCAPFLCCLLLHNSKCCFNHPGASFFSLFSLSTTLITPLNPLHVLLKIICDLCFALSNLSSHPNKLFRNSRQS